MLAAERRGELGIARAVGTRRGHLVQMFLFEGLAYDLLAAAVGVAARRRGRLRDGARDGRRVRDATSDFHDHVLRQADELRRSRYAIGVLLTLAVVAFSAWRVSRMNIVTAIRNLPEPPREKERRRRWLLGVARRCSLGALLAVAGRRAPRTRSSLGLGVSLVILEPRPDPARARRARARGPHRRRARARRSGSCCRSAAGCFGELKVNFSIFILGGLMIVIGAIWTLMYNADVLLGALGAVARADPRPRAGAADVDGLSAAEPASAPASRSRCSRSSSSRSSSARRPSGAFANAFNDLGHVRRRLRRAGDDARRRSRSWTCRRPLARTPGLRAAATSASSRASRRCRSRRASSAPPAKEESYIVHGADARFLAHTTYGLAARAHGLRLGCRGLAARSGRDRNLAVVDPLVVPRKRELELRGAAEVPAEAASTSRTRPSTRCTSTVRDPQTGKRVTLTVIGVLSDSAPRVHGGHLDVAARRSRPVFGDRVLPTIHLFALRPASTRRRRRSDARVGVPRQTACRPTRSTKLLARRRRGERDLRTGWSMGFMGLGLIVGVAALGVITRPRRRRAAAADRRPARDRLPQADGAARASCSSRRSSR